MGTPCWRRALTPLLCLSCISLQKEIFVAVEALASCDCDHRICNSPRPNFTDAWAKAKWHCCCGQEEVGPAISQQGGNSSSSSQEGGGEGAEGGSSQTPTLSPAQLSILIPLMETSTVLPTLPPSTSSSPIISTTGGAASTSSTSATDDGNAIADGSSSSEGGAVAGAAGTESSTSGTSASGSGTSGSSNAAPTGAGDAGTEGSTSGASTGGDGNAAAADNIGSSGSNNAGSVGAGAGGTEGSTSGASTGGDSNAAAVDNTGSSGSSTAGSIGAGAGGTEGSTSGASTGGDGNAATSDNTGSSESSTAGSTGAGAGGTEGSTSGASTGGDGNAAADDSGSAGSSSSEGFAGAGGVEADGGGAEAGGAEGNAVVIGGSSAGSAANGSESSGGSSGTSSSVEDNGVTTTTATTTEKLVDLDAPTLPPPTHCNEKDVMYEPMDMNYSSADITIADVDACQDLCRRTTSCGFFSFYEGLKICHLALPTAVKKTGRIGFRGGAASCSDAGTGGDLQTVRTLLFAEECMSTNVSYAPLWGRGRPSTYVNSPDECQATCSKVSWCETFVYNTLTKACDLQDGTAKPQYHVDYQISGPPICDPRVRFIMLVNGLDSYVNGSETRESRIETVIEHSLVMYLGSYTPYDGNTKLEQRPLLRSGETRVELHDRHSGSDWVAVRLNVTRTRALYIKELLEMPEAVEGIQQQGENFVAYYFPDEEEHPQITAIQNVTIRVRTWHHGERQGMFFKQDELPGEGSSPIWSRPSQGLLMASGAMLMAMLALPLLRQLPSRRDGRAASLEWLHREEVPESSMRLMTSADDEESKAAEMGAVV